MKRNLTLLGIASLAALLIGCGEKSAPEPAASKQAAAEAASAWTPEQAAKFKELNQKARAGKDDQ